MNQFEPIFGKKLRDIVLKPFFKHRYILLILTVAFLRHTIKIIHLFTEGYPKKVFSIF
jgi:hypothetical protein